MYYIYIWINLHIYKTIHLLYEVIYIYISLILYTHKMYQKKIPAFLVIFHPVHQAPSFFFSKDWCCDCTSGRLGWFAGLRGSESSDLENLENLPTLFLDFFLKKNIHPWSLTRPLKNGGCKTTFLLGFGNFSGAMLNFGVYNLEIFTFWTPKNGGLWGLEDSINSFLKIVNLDTLASYSASPEEPLSTLVVPKVAVLVIRENGWYP